MARLTGRSYEEMRVSILEFLDTDASNLSVENCVTFLEPLIESWDLDLAIFGMEIVFNGRLAPGDPKKFEFVEREPGQPEEERGLKEFLRDTSLNLGATEEEIEFLKKLRLKGKRPAALYYYRELQNLRDPLNFRAVMTQTPRAKIQGQSQSERSVARCTSIGRLMTSKDHCSLTAGKGQRSAGQGTKAVGAKNKRQRRRDFSRSRYKTTSASSRGICTSSLTSWRFSTKSRSYLCNSLVRSPASGEKGSPSAQHFALAHTCRLKLTESNSRPGYVPAFRGPSQNSGLQKLIS